MDPVERAKLKARLDEAEDAMHKLSIGGQARVVVDQNGERVEFFATRRNELRSYIMTLRVQLGMDTGISGPLSVRALP